MEHKSTSPDTGDSGEVTSIKWGAGPPSQVDIDAVDVFTAGTWHASYSWNGDTKVLTLSKPQPGPKPASAHHHHHASDAAPPPDIEELHIDCWGQSKLRPPLEWTGAQSGTVNIVFHDGPHTSGPVGGLDGP